jgi:hypothetical protein
MARPKSTILSPKQEKLVEGILSGKSEQAAIHDAGYNTNNQSVARSKQVKEALESSRKTIMDATTLSRLDVIEGFMEAIGVARTQSDPGNMINGWDKLAKVIGAYEPQKVQIEMGEGGRMLLKKMEAMTRDQLASIAAGEARVINGEFVRVGS